MYKSKTQQHRSATQSRFDFKTLGRLFSYMKEYKWQLVAVTVCILLSAVASAVSAIFCRRLSIITSHLFLENRLPFFGADKSLNHIKRRLCHRSIGYAFL